MNSKRITVRRPNYIFTSDIPEHWFAESALFSHIGNSLFLSFPQGERFFIHSVQAFAKQVQDTALREEIKAFVAQEVQHTKEHENHFEILRAQGYDVEGILNFYRIYATEGIEVIAEKLFGKRMHLAMTAASEHFTALFSELAFEWNLPEYMHPQIADLTSWHGAEEMEHRHIAFNVMQETGISYPERMLGLFFTVILLSGLTVSGTAKLLLNDKALDLRKLGEDFLFLLKGFFPVTHTVTDHEGTQKKRTEAFGFLGQLIIGIVDYIRPNFHPDDRNSRHLAAAGLKQFEKSA
ncbi:MAG TPA: metal-dependent hydrolase [Leptospiraceae bacterium]|nr:metal-dependent hydrolase [Leptospiraceae bacterium]HMY68595.1 metal-dependent hydrolase [Leptospiraceae bacterium]HNF14933.1 metal-dependent hydrolase [Leptospiraceae bacterium]HNF24050.1 metal-dependent hydrolase [Leptospiraceae bacterium]HNH07496.1 metal-dependent hydrolase [Leptospiraceae bacterium]